MGGGRVAHQNDPAAGRCCVEAWPMGRDWAAAASLCRTVAGIQRPWRVARGNGWRSLLVLLEPIADQKKKSSGNNKLKKQKMRILVINPNTTIAVTETIVAEARRCAPPQVE